MAAIRRNSSWHEKTVRIVASFNGKDERDGGSASIDRDTNTGIGATPSHKPRRYMVG